MINSVMKIRKQFSDQKVYFACKVHSGLRAYREIIFDIEENEFTCFAHGIVQEITITPKFK